MSWLSTFTLSGSAQDLNESAAIEHIQRTRSWLMTYIALVTSLLAFFILIISMIEIEGSSLKRDHQKLTQAIYMDVKAAVADQSIDWLQVENTLTKGVRISIKPNLIRNQNLFASAQAKINPRYLPYLQSLAEVLQQVDIEALRQRYMKLVSSIEANGFDVKMMIRIEGHTDAHPLAQTARFKNNIELSTFRAYAMMDWLRIHLPLTRSHFVIAGYGSFQPILDDVYAADNRRIEIYIQPMLKQQRELAGTIL
ncbi:OmpA/MotB family protein [Thiomicrorhabdus sediminis]|uniref:Cell envelope biogenesis protein OmpA n=1 Tax=Thiomicrorhabdus sediminis TaxID=2580412 RepID=A0A4P9K3L8_9GAMM|nr:flagellar motor protein MotB [Thiomicrorhabdus sediminis]QCU89482.1 cell envelope biogenesis protein OmpA [Thiomicrorhabdus sediminis]